jgi:hypothetical protein
MRPIAGWATIFTSSTPWRAVLRMSVSKRLSGSTPKRIAQAAAATPPACRPSTHQSTRRRQILGDRMRRATGETSGLPYSGPPMTAPSACAVSAQ